MFNERIVPIVGLKWGTRLALSQLALSQVEGVEGLALSQVEGVARFSSGISPTIGVGLIHELALQSALSNGKMLRISTGALHLSSSDLTTPKTLWGEAFRLFLLTIAFDNFPNGVSPGLWDIWRENHQLSLLILANG